MEFPELSRKVIALYFDGSYREALDVVADGRELFPEEDSTLTWYEACLRSVSGGPSQTLEILNAGVDRGLGWHPKMLLDQDLDSARALDGWEAFVERSASQVDGWDLQQPDPLIRNVPNPVGTVIALHGAGNNPALIFSDWNEATPREWDLIAPTGNVPVSASEWAWPFDLNPAPLLAALDGVSLPEPVVLLGFSQGSGLAARTAWDGHIAVSGVVLTAAGPSPEPWRESQRRPVPTYIVTETADGGHERCLAIATVLQDAGVPVFLDIREGLGHMFPDDLDRTIVQALDWIRSQR